MLSGGDNFSRQKGFLNLNDIYRLNLAEFDQAIFVEYVIKINSKYF